MGATVTANSPMTVVHKKSDGMSPVFPDVCKTPAPPGAPIPIPYPNLAKSSDASQTATSVKADGQKIMLKKSVYRTSDRRRTASAVDGTRRRAAGAG
jgi:hypothetical protein